MKEIYKFLFEAMIAVLTLILVGIISNQIAQPLISPRLSSFSVSRPLYVQSQIIDDKPVYYKVFKITYNIEPALFAPLPQNLTISLPGKSVTELDFVSAENVELITQLRETSPYADVLIHEILRNENFVDTSRLDNKLNISIKTNGWDVKSISLDLYFREKTEIEERSPSYSDYRWWSSSTISPESPIYVLRYGQSLGFSKSLDGGYQQLNLVTIENINDIPIREYWLEVSNHVFIRVCDESVELSKAGLNDKMYVVFDLESHEKKNLTFIEYLGINPPEGFRIYGTDSLECFFLTKSLKETLNQ